ncbi:MAG: response regulator [Planctomycetes bacterium]|nr:response regulator [Planctomycetota bacterium]
MKHKILVVDDTPNILHIIKIFLEKEGYQVCAYKNPLDALRHATREEFSLYIIDIMMPTVDGFTMIRILKNNSFTRGVPIILMSARGLLLETPKNIKYNVYGFIPKPFTKDLLVKVVERSLLTAYQDELTVSN